MSGKRIRSLALSNQGVRSAYVKRPRSKELVMLWYGSLAAALALTLVASPAGQTTPPPNLTGTWVLVPAKSDLGGVDFGGDRTDIIEHQGDRLTIKLTLSSPSLSATLVYAIDGKDYRNTIGHNEVTSTLARDGRVLVMKSTPPHRPTRGASDGPVHVVGGRQGPDHRGPRSGAAPDHGVHQEVGCKT